MSNPRTGQLGGFGLTTVGGPPEQGDLAVRMRGAFKHYRFHDSSAATSASDEFGGIALAGTGTNSQLPSFGNPGSSFTSMSFPVWTGTTENGSMAFARDSPASNHWHNYFTAGTGSIEFWFKLAALPQDGSLAAQVLTIGDPDATDPDTGGSARPYVCITMGRAAQSSGRDLWILGGNGFAFGIDAGDLQWHHYKMCWSIPGQYRRCYADGVLKFDGAAFSSRTTGQGTGTAPAGGAYVGGTFYPAGTVYYYPTFTTVSWPPPLPAAYLSVGGTSFGSHGSAGETSIIGCAGLFEDLVISNVANDVGTYNPVYAQATTTFTIGSNGYPAKPGRVTQGFAEVAHDNTRNLRVTQAFAEVIRTGNYQGRISQLFVEVLQSQPAPVWNVSATSSFNLTPSSTKLVGHALTVSATSSFGVHVSDTARVGHQLPVSATTSFSASATTRAYIPAVYTRTASSGFNVAANGTAVVHNPQPYFVSAASSFYFSPSSRIGLTRVLQLAATTSMNFSGAAFAPTTFHMNATSSLQFTTRGVGRTTALFVSASSGMTLRATAPALVFFGSKYVSAGTTINFTQLATRSFNTTLAVSALSSIILSNVAREIKRGAIIVSATSRLALSTPVSYTNPGPRLVSAGTNLSLAATATYGRSAILRVSAGTTISLSGAGSEKAALGVSAGSTFVVSSAGKQNRDIHSAATTALGLSNAPRTGNLKPLDATSTVTFAAVASLTITGTLAESGLVFTDLAQAVVWIPWRRAALSLPAGGNLPHS